MDILILNTMDKIIMPMNMARKMKMMMIKQILTLSPMIKCNTSSIMTMMTMKKTMSATQTSASIKTIVKRHQTIKMMKIQVKIYLLSIKTQTIHQTLLTSKPFTSSNQQNKIQEEQMKKRSGILVRKQVHILSFLICARG